MSHDAPHTFVVMDASVLINFLAVDRMRDLVALEDRCFIITDHVRGEVTARYPAQLERLDSIVAAGLLEVVSVTGGDELETFANLTEQGLGKGECASIALAHHRGWELAADDKVARKRAARLNPAPSLHGTRSLTIDLIRAGLITVVQADAMLAEWRTKHRFRLKIHTFAQALPDS